MFKYDITILTDHRYVAPKKLSNYIQNVLTEDRLVLDALKRKGLRVHRISWDDSNFDWASTQYVLFRSTWDYFDRYEEFTTWLEKVRYQTLMINPYELISWNLDKHYLRDLQNKGIKITPTQFIEVGIKESLSKIIQQSGWNEVILKPAISGAARHTYRLGATNIEAHEDIFKELIASESMLLQPFQRNILTKGEVAFMIMGGKFTHAILKKAKPGDFRVQDYFGGSIHPYEATSTEIEFAEKVVDAVLPSPLYARVDAIWDNENQLCISEVEMIEPELWFRENPSAADTLADAILKYIQASNH